jgi:heme oxygenase
MTDHEYEVAEPMVTTNYYRVRARNRAEAIEKVMNQEQIEDWRGDVHPDARRSMSVRRVRDTE